MLLTMRAGFLFGVLGKFGSWMVVMVAHNVVSLMNAPRLGA